MRRFVSMLACGALFAALGSAASAFTIIERNDYNQDTNQAYGDASGYCGNQVASTSMGRAGFTVRYQSDDQGTTYWLDGDRGMIEGDSEYAVISVYCRNRGD